MTEFKNRVFGCAIIKAINSNYNADFSGQPRTLPSGVVYATDKAFKYTVKNYLKDVYADQIFYFKSLNENLNPRSLDERYKLIFGEYPKSKGKGKKDEITKIEVAKNLLTCLDVRCFGATFAGATNISVHGPVQVNHGVNIWKENNIYTEQITSPFSNKADDADAEKGNTTIGRQSKLEEGHYLHHFSINPGNLSELASIIGDGAKKLDTDDISKLKEGMRRGATWYDSASKAGCENEMLVWVQLKEGSKKVFPSFATLVHLMDKKEDGKCVYDFASLKSLLDKNAADIEMVEVYFDKSASKIINLPENVNLYDI